ncbi:DUF2244 domain-containing protein [Actibacterium lipolyticum]|uniref:DUF2244 domain-containing protein n=1 Tax=Actibacterium lipolyticum TaxID=1524263 RepID=A0A238KKH4_9RHOB|nr:DUF2244 domain-containing protein [Actibacterium lipolyticum]SMX43214.1 hypothetical protein COL8621_02244 [Actibacterium lipolyticum]
MPYEWDINEKGAPDISGAFSFEAGDPPAATLHLWPYRSLPRKGFVTFFAITCVLVLLPLFAVLGSPILWGLLPFIGGAIALTWYLLERSYKDAEILEELRLWSDRVELTRHNPRGPKQDWHANPYWLRIEMHPKGGPVENYLTLRGGERDVELGAFLSPEERAELYGELQGMLSRIRGKQHNP